ncbi:MAG: hypothetical protein ETSY1_22230 [Candidatus Entotheonella factor]|uniref:Uncharacterized protein n=1 Tax=Entotheonella factor TaxID=1429438 RepID=W4LIK1_ENTF1|nr:hypothetical protein [Candidatus Entotheonella palauensis]ETW97545.1 MAG: hypothetical protein ETSY1_22230 [Candidatus Entotheonella factor]
MTDRFSSVMLYHAGDPDISQALLRCSDLVAWICQGLYPGADPYGQHPDPTITPTEPPTTLLWWLCSLQATLDGLHCHVSADLPDSLTTSLQAYLAQHPEQSSRLRQVLVEANAHNFTQWDQVIACMTSPKPVQKSKGAES